VRKSLEKRTKPRLVLRDQIIFEFPILFLPPMARNTSGPRPSSSSKHKKFTQSTKKYNAAGFAKRQAQKAAKAAARSDDFYEYAPEKSRRAKIGLDLDREEALDAGVGPSLGSDGEGEDNIEDFRMRARLIGENEDDEQIASDDDEEIDSDAAFEEEDEDRYAGFFSSKVCPFNYSILHTLTYTQKKGSTKKRPRKSAVRFADVDLNEDEDEEGGSQDQDMDQDDEEESGPDDEFIDVLDILDGREKPLSFSDDDEEDAKSSKQDSTSKFAQTSSLDMENDSDASKSDEEDEGDEEDDKISISLSDAEEEAVGALDELHNFISSLDKDSSGNKRKASADDGEEVPTHSKKRRVLKERTEVGTESEFRTKSAGMSTNPLFIALSH
jgi:U3 small nucleolar RNA-associated protein 14